MYAVVGMLGALVGIGLFLIGFWVGKSVYELKLPPEVTPTEEEAAQIREERERLIQEQKAFQELVNYNSNTAYGLDKVNTGNAG